MFKYGRLPATDREIEESALLPRTHVKQQRSEAGS